MKILLLADIHANWPALQAINESFDACLFVGDAVDYATQPGECVAWLQQNATACIRGNHDHSVAQRVTVRPGGTFRQMSAAMRESQFNQLDEQQLTWLAQLPVTQYIEVGGLKFLLVHATPRDPMDEYLEPNEELWRTRLEHVDVDFVVCGHTHVPMDLQLENARVVNPGSVGQPRDNDPRAAYAIIEDGELRFCRIDYDINATIQHMKESGIDPGILETASNVLRTGGKPTLD